MYNKQRSHKSKLLNFIEQRHKMAEAAADGDPAADLTFVPSPETRASVQIQLIGKIQVIGIDQGQEDLRLYFLVLRPDNITAFQQLLPELVEISPDLVNAQTIISLASEVERTRSKTNKVRVVNAINGRGF